RCVRLRARPPDRARPRASLVPRRRLAGLDTADRPGTPACPADTSATRLCVRAVRLRSVVRDRSCPFGPALPLICGTGRTNLRTLAIPGPAASRRRDDRGEAAFAQPMRGVLDLSDTPVVFPEAEHRQCAPGGPRT